MNRNYVEIRIRTSVDAGELLGLLDETASSGACETEDGLFLYWPTERWKPEVLDAIREGLRCLGDMQAEKTLIVAEIPDQDWNVRWAESLQPIRLGHRILIRQSWNSAEVPPGGFELVIDPKRAFGTGYHATTQLIAEWLEEAVCGGERVLDVGTGSGILAMAALRLGARSALGIDRDPEAIGCAREYAAVNGFGEELELRVAALEDLPVERFDLILANLDRPTLLRYFAGLHGYLQAGGKMLVSGLLIEDDREIIGALAAAGWRATELRRREEWMALELTPGNVRDSRNP